MRFSCSIAARVLRSLGGDFHSFDALTVILPHQERSHIRSFARNVEPAMFGEFSRLLIGYGKGEDRPFLSRSVVW